MFVKHKNYNLPDKDGFFGEFGGMFVPENFKPVLRKLDEEFEKAIKDENYPQLLIMFIIQKILLITLKLLCP